MLGFLKENVYSVCLLHTHFTTLKTAWVKSIFHVTTRDRSAGDWNRLVFWLAGCGLWQISQSDSAPIVFTRCLWTAVWFVSSAHLSHTALGWLWPRRWSSCSQVGRFVVWFPALHPCMSKYPIPTCTHLSLNEKILIIQLYDIKKIFSFCYCLFFILQKAKKKEY